MMNKLLRIVALCFATAMFLLLVGCASKRQLNRTPEDTLNVEITVTQTASYCGGARPSEEILQELNSPIPSANTKVFIGRGVENAGHGVILETVTDVDGKVRVELPSGDYYLVFETKTIENKTKLLGAYREETAYYSAMDVDCLENWFKQPDFVFSVEKNKSKSVVVNKHIPCSWSAIPCVDYRGPLPP
jgi:hypothetical protein